MTANDATHDGTDVQGETNNGKRNTTHTVEVA